MKAILFLAFAAASLAVIRAHDGQTEEPKDDQREDQREDQRKAKWSNIKPLTDQRIAILEVQIRGCVQDETGTGLNQILEGVTDNLLKTSNTLIDKVGEGAQSIVTTVISLVLTPLGIVIALTLVVLGLCGGFMTLVGMPIGIIGGIAASALGVAVQFIPTIMGMVDGLLGGLGKK